MKGWLTNIMLIRKDEKIKISDWFLHYYSLSFPSILNNIQELMINQLSNSKSFLRILRQTSHYKIFNLRRCRLTSRKIYLFIHNFYHIILTSYLKWHSTISQLICQYPYIPNINLIIILLFLNQFWWSIQRCST